MKTILRFAFFAVLFVLQVNLMAQEPIPSKIIGEDIRRLARIVNIIEQVNAIVIEFKPFTTQIDSASDANLMKQATLLKQLPSGAIVEIGAHTWGYYDKSSGRAVAGLPTAERAEAVRRKLIEFGIAPASLIARGYGITKPIDTSKPFAESSKNERLEFLVAKMPGGKNVAAQNAAQKDVSNASAIIAGQGWDKIFLGAARSAIEAAVGQPDEFVDEDVGLFRIYEANYYSKGFKVEYDPKTKIATAILFFGDAAKTKGFSKFRLFPGATDKAIRWGMSPADVIKAYGKPVEERMRYNPKLDKDYEFITYPNVAFGFAENRLVYIANNPIWGKR